MHEVKTGVCVLDAAAGLHVEGVETTRVYVAQASDDELIRYIRSGEPMDKAGAYAVQGMGARFIRRIEGCFYNVVGLPLGLTLDLIGELERLCDERLNARS
jgi:septum formation protein